MRVAILCIMLVPLATRAEDRSARALFDEGARLVRERRFAEACPLLEESLARATVVSTRGKLAECYEGLGRVASAWKMWGACAEQAHAEEDKREAFALARAQALEPQLPRIVIHAPRIDGLVVSCDGEPAPFESRLPVDPGRHRVAASAPGYREWQEELDLVAGEIHVVVVDPQKVVAPTPPPIAPLPPVVEETVAAPSHRGQRMIGIGVAASGVVAIAAGGVFGLRAKSKWDQAFEGPSPPCDETRSCDPHGLDLTADARRNATIANVLVASGAALAIGGAIVWWTGREPPAHVSMSVSAGEVGVVVGGSL